MKRITKNALVGLFCLGFVLSFADLSFAASSKSKVAPDKDYDGMADSWEKANGLNPRKKDGNLDKDHDGLTNIKEYRLHTKANNADSDSDFIKDGDEVLLFHTNPRNDDSDGDGIEDGDEDANGNEIDNEDENDLAAIDKDDDGDGLDDEDENEFDTDIDDSDTDHDGIIDGNEDFDEDGIDNEDEDDQIEDEDGNEDEDEDDDGAEVEDHAAVINVEGVGYFKLFQA